MRCMGYLCGEVACMRNAGYETLAGKRRLYGEWEPGYEGIPQPSPVFARPARD